MALSIADLRGVEFGPCALLGNGESLGCGQRHAAKSLLLLCQKHGGMIPTLGMNRTLWAGELGVSIDREHHGSDSVNPVVRWGLGEEFDVPWLPRGRNPRFRGFELNGGTQAAFTGYFALRGMKRRSGSAAFSKRERCSMPGVTVLNANPDSAIGAFPKVAL